MSPATAADLVAQESAVTTADMTNVFNAAIAILYPYYTTRRQDHRHQHRR